MSILEPSAYPLSSSKGNRYPDFYYHRLLCLFLNLM